MAIPLELASPVFNHTPRVVSQKIVIAIAGEGTDTRHVCKLASPFQDMVNPQVNLFQ